MPRGMGRQKRKGQWDCVTLHSLSSQNYLIRDGACSCGRASTATIPANLACLTRGSPTPSGQWRKRTPTWLGDLMYHAVWHFRHTVDVSLTPCRLNAPAAGSGRLYKLFLVYSILPQSSPSRQTTTRLPSPKLPPLFEHHAFLHRLCCSLCCFCHHLGVTSRE